MNKKGKIWFPFRSPFRSFICYFPRTLYDEILWNRKSESRFEFYLEYLLQGWVNLSIVWQTQFFLLSLDIGLEKISPIVFLTTPNTLKNVMFGQLFWANTWKVHWLYRHLSKHKIACYFFCCQKSAWSEYIESVVLIWWISYLYNRFSGQNFF